MPKYAGLMLTGHALQAEEKLVILFHLSPLLAAHEHLELVQERFPARFTIIPQEIGLPITMGHRWIPTMTA